MLLLLHIALALVVQGMMTVVVNISSSIGISR
jgi:hypothetical protein